MKFASSLLLFTFAASFTGCDTLVTNRKLYSPKQGEGHFTNLWYEYHQKEGFFGVSTSIHRHPQPGPSVGIFGISNSRHEATGMGPGPDEGLFGISHPPR